MFKESKNQVHCTLWLLLYKIVKKKIQKRNRRVKFWYQLYIATDWCHAENTECCDQCLFETHSPHIFITMSHLNHFISPLKTSNEAVNLSTTTELNHRNSTVCERVINNQQRSFLYEDAHWDLIKSTWPVTATVVHSHRNQILHFESLLEIQIAAGT